MSPIRNGVTALFDPKSRVGSSREAHPAGKTQAAPATNSSTKLTKPNTAGSIGRVP